MINKGIVFGLLLLVTLALSQEATDSQIEGDVNKEAVPDQEGEEFLLKALLFKKLLHGGGGFGHARHFGGYGGGYYGGYRGHGGYGGYGGYEGYGGYRPAYYGGFGANRYGR